jgi:hypothetical protein
MVKTTLLLSNEKLAVYTKPVDKIQGMGICNLLETLAISFK